MTDAEKQEALAGLGLAIAAKRTEAVDAHKASGIGAIWEQCEEAYLGIDDANRHEWQGAMWAKPLSMQGPLTSAKSGGRPDGRSTIYIPLTQRYVDMGTAKVSEILLPIDDKAFSIEPTSIPELIKGKDDLTPVMGPDGRPIMRKPGPDEAPPQPAQTQPGMPPQNGQDGAQAQVPVLAKDLAEEDLEKAKESAEKAEKRIYDWMMESNYPAEMRKVIHDAGRVGVGILKGPFPDVTQSQAMSKVQDGIALEIVRKVSPVVRWISYDNLFPAPSCGENIHDGDFTLERDFISKRELQKLRSRQGYIKSEIERVLKQGPNKCYEDNSKQNEKKGDGRFEIWYYYGTIKRSDFLLTNAIGAKDIPEDQDEVSAIITLVNDSVIRATINPLEKSGRYPYNVIRWSRRAGSWTGVGIAEQMRPAQRICNAANRRMLDNAGISSGAQFVIDQTAIIPGDGSWTITPNKIWKKASDATFDDVRKVFMSLDFPNNQESLMAVVQYATKLAEEITNIPLISQGQNGPTTPDTFGATELQNNNANTLLRSIAYNFDDSITSPVVHSFYEWLLLDPNVPDDEKGDFQINAKGSIAMVEKAIQEQTMAQMAQMVVNPAFGVDPKKWFAEWMRTKRLDPRKIQYTEDEIKQMQQQQQPQAPQIAVAQIRAQADAQKTQALLAAEAQRTQAELAVQQQIAQQSNQTDITRIKSDVDRDAIYVQAQNSRDQATHDYNMRKLELEVQLEQLKYANEQKISIDQVKAQLAQTAMKINAQKELSAASLMVDVHKHSTDQALTPPTEPAGRADTGQAFQE